MPEIVGIEPARFKEALAEMHKSGLITVAGVGLSIMVDPDDESRDPRFLIQASTSNPELSAYLNKICERFSILLEPSISEDLMKDLRLLGAEIREARDSKESAAPPK